MSLKMRTKTYPTKMYSGTDLDCSNETRISMYLSPLNEFSCTFVYASVSLPQVHHEPANHESRSIFKLGKIMDG